MVVLTMTLVGKGVICDLLALRFGGVLVGVWLGAMAQAWVRLGSVMGVLLALMMHLVVVGYLVGILGAIGAMVGLLRVMNTGILSHALAFAGLLAAMGLLMLLTRLADRAIASCWMRRYLRQRPVPDLSERSGTG
jgi:hypothetical protein